MDRPLRIVARKLGSFGLLASIALGCASAALKPVHRPGELPEPERILVRDFAVTQNDVALDRGIVPTMSRDAQGELRSTQAERLGRAASNALAEELVARLRKAGLPAQRSRGDPALTPTTLVITGKFLTIDEGNQTLRTLVGFGTGASHVKTRAQAWMDQQLVAEAVIDAKSGRKPGAGVTVGAGAAAGTLATAAGVAAGTTTVSELMLTSAQADAKRTAREIADRIILAYRERGWLPD
jgi:hypothetical protein